MCGLLEAPHIIFAWALNASGFELPVGVGQLVGPSNNINYLVLQIHYGEIQGESQCTRECSKTNAKL